MPLLVFLLLLPFVLSAQPAQPAPRTYTPPAAVRTIDATARRLNVDAVDFVRIVSVVPRADGSLVVADAGAFQLLFFDRTGRRVRTVGRGGGGPGEYRDISGLTALRADTLAVWDRDLRRISILAPDGTYVRSIPLEAPFEGGGGSTRVIGLTGGSLLVGFSEVTQMAPQPDPIHFGERLFEYTTDGTRRPGAGLRLMSSEHFVQQVPMERGGVAYWDRAFGRRLTVRPVAEGIVTGDGAEWSVDVRRFPTGDVIGAHRLQRAVEPVSDQDRATYREEVTRSARTDADRLVNERLANAMPFPRTKPAYSRFEVDPRGRLWLEDYGQRREPQTLWYRLDPAGSAAAAVRMPARFRPLAFTETAVYGIWRDADDVQVLRGYALDGR